MTITPRRRGRARAPEVVVEGRPDLRVADEDREPLADLLADALLADLDERKDGAA